MSNGQLVSACSVSSRGLLRCLGVDKQIEFVLYLFLMGVREVTESLDTSTPLVVHDCHRSRALELAHLNTILWYFLFERTRYERSSDYNRARLLVVLARVRFVLN